MTKPALPPFETTVFSEKYPPKNRKDLGLGVLDMEVVDGYGALKLDPMRAAIVGALRKLPVDAPKHQSLLSEKPGFLYRDPDGVEVALTEDELLRLFRRELKPSEYFKLRDEFGVFQVIHDDFYCEESGEALQPMSER